MRILSHIIPTLTILLGCYNLIGKGGETVAIPMKNNDSLQSQRLFNGENGVYKVKGEYYAKGSSERSPYIYLVDYVDKQANETYSLEYQCSRPLNLLEFLKDVWTGELDKEREDPYDDLTITVSNGQFTCEVEEE